MDRKLAAAFTRQELSRLRAAAVDVLGTAHPGEEPFMGEPWATWEAERADRYTPFEGCRALIWEAAKIGGEINHPALDWAIESVLEHEGGVRGLMRRSTLTEG